MKNKNHVITSHNVEQEVLKSVRSDVVISNELDNGETCQGLQHWRLLSNLKNNFSKPVRNDMIGSLALGGRGLGRGGSNKNVKTLVPQCPSALKPLKKKVAFTFSEGATHVDLPPTKVKFAFTLAEVLITLGIIGVVAAMTIPTLMTNIKAQKMRTAFLKQYSVVQQVFKQMEADDVSLDPSTYTGVTFYKTFAKYLSGATLCYNKKNELCYTSTSEDIYKGIYKYFLDDGGILLKDGTLLMFENPGKTFHANVFITVDLNGIKNPPNMLGFDTFTFEFKDGILRTMGDKDTEYQGDEYCDLDKVFKMKSPYHANVGIACAQKAKENSDYFKKLYHKYK